MAAVTTVYAGRAGQLVTPTGVVRTAIAKRARDGAVSVGVDGIPGDEQVHPGHGGPDRALCVYPSEHQEHWSRQAGGPLPQPPFGENLTTRGVLERDTRIGDVWRIGTVVAQVAQPRSPCAKVAARLGIPGLVMAARRTRRTGLHLRVLEPGELRAGDPVELLDRPAHAITVADAVAARFDPAPARELVAAVLALPELAAEWRTRTAPRAAAA